MPYTYIRVHRNLAVNQLSNRNSVHNFRNFRLTRRGGVLPTPLYGAGPH